MDFNVKRYLVPLVCAAALLQITPTQAQSNTRYVSDYCRIPLRSGPSNQHRVIHWGLPSGTRLSFTGEEKDKYSQVQTTKGKIGWIESQYLQAQPVARARIKAAAAAEARAKAKLEQLSSSLKQATASGKSSASKAQSLEQENANLQLELDRIKRISANAIKLTTDNRSLIKTNQELRDEVDVLKTENIRLKDKQDSDAFLNGAFAVLIGVFITLLVPRLWPKRKSEWT